MSSAAMLGIVVGGFLVAYDWLSERIANLSWRMFLFFTAILYVTVELTSKSGFYSILIRYASLNTGSAYNRILIWQYGTQNIERHPWFGIGYADWDRPDWMHGAHSITSGSSMRYGSAFLFPFSFWARP
jgi:O-antigen ligase